MHRSDHNKAFLATFIAQTAWEPGAFCDTTLRGGNLGNGVVVSRRASPPIALPMNWYTPARAVRGPGQAAHREPEEDHHDSTTALQGSVAMSAQALMRIKTSVSGTTALAQWQTRWRCPQTPILNHFSSAWATVNSARPNPTNHSVLMAKKDTAPEKQQHRKHHAQGIKAPWSKPPGTAVVPDPPALETFLLPGAHLLGRARDQALTGTRSTGQTKKLFAKSWCLWLSCSMSILSGHASRFEALGSLA